METYIVWLGIFLKQQLKSRLYWLQLLLMFAGICCLASIRFPSADNCLIGYCYDRPEAENWLTAELSEQEAVLEFCFYTEKNELYADIASGKMDCGFVLPAQVKEGKTIERVRSPMSTKCALAELTVFGACYRLLSEDVLVKADRLLYENADQERTELLLRNNREIRESSRVFDIRMTEIPVEDSDRRKTTSRLPVQGMAGMFVMMIILLANGIVFDPKNKGVFLALPTGRRRCMRLLYSLTAGLLPAVGSLMLICFFGCSRGIIVEMVSMVLLMIWIGLWIRFGGERQRIPEYYHVETVLFLLVQLLICPVFTDVAELLPVFGLIRLFMPLGIYLYL